MKSLTIDGLNFVLESLDDFLTLSLDESKKKFVSVVTPNPEIYLQMYADKLYQKKLRAFSYALCDGFGLQVALRCSGYQLPRLTGTDLVKQILKRQERLFVVGSSDVACQKLQIANRYCAKVSAGDFRSLVDQIKKADPAVVLVALGAPKQEEFIAFCQKHFDKVLFIGVGGAIDYASGEVVRAPLFMQKMGLEWLFRLWKQPRRLVRIFRAVCVFPLVYFWRKFCL